MRFLLLMLFASWLFSSSAMAASDAVEELQDEKVAYCEQLGKKFLSRLGEATSGYKKMKQFNETLRAKRAEKKNGQRYEDALQKAVKATEKVAEFMELMERGVNVTTRCSDMQVCTTCSERVEMDKINKQTANVAKFVKIYNRHRGGLDDAYHKYNSAMEAAKKLDKKLAEQNKEKELEHF